MEDLLEEFTIRETRINSLNYKFHYVALNATFTLDVTHQSSVTSLYQPLRSHTVFFLTKATNCVQEAGSCQQEERHARSHDPELAYVSTVSLEVNSMTYATKLSRLERNATISLLLHLPPELRNRIYSYVLSGVLSLSSLIKNREQVLGAPTNPCLADKLSNLEDSTRLRPPVQSHGSRVETLKAIIYTVDLAL